MIFTDRTITVRKGESRIDEPIVVYRGDYELEVRFTILNSRFKFMSGTNMIESEKASYGQLAILTPYGGNIFSDIVRCNDGSVTFVLTADMLNQIEEVGLYSFQIRLMDYNKESRVSIPPIEFGIEVREPIASEDHDNSVNNAIVGYSIAKVVDPKEEKVGDTFDKSGNYNKTKWETGDRISEGKLNKIEDAIDKVNKNEMNNSASLSKRIDNNFNVLDSTKADTTYVDDIFKKVSSGSPKGVYSSLSELTSAIPEGDNNIYLTSDNGNWNYWNGSSWVTGGVYQSTGLDEKSIDKQHIDNLSTNNIFTLDCLCDGYIDCVSLKIKDGQTPHKYAKMQVNQGKKYLFARDLIGGGGSTTHLGTSDLVAYLDSNNTLMFMERMTHNFCGTDKDGIGYAMLYIPEGAKYVCVNVKIDSFNVARENGIYMMEFDSDDLNNIFIKEIFGIETIFGESMVDNQARRFIKDHLNDIKSSSNNIVNNTTTRIFKDALVDTLINISISSGWYYASIKVDPASTYCIYYGSQVYTPAKGGILFQRSDRSKISGLSYTDVTKIALSNKQGYIKITTPSDCSYLCLTLKSSETYGVQYDDRNTLVVTKNNMTVNDINPYAVKINGMNIVTPNDIPSLTVKGNLFKNNDIKIINNALYDNTGYLNKGVNGWVCVDIPVDPDSTYYFYSPSQIYEYGSRGKIVLMDVTRTVVKFIDNQNRDLYEYNGKWQIINTTNDIYYIGVTVKNPNNGFNDLKEGILLNEIPNKDNVTLNAYVTEINNYPILNNTQSTYTDPLKGKKWVVVGDSLTEKNSRATKNYHDYVAKSTGINVVNMGVSGTGYKRQEENNRAFYQRILNIPKDTDIVTIFGSGNDLSQTLGTPTDTGTDTICGCMHKTIQNLFSVIPGVRVGIVLPCPWGPYQPSNKENVMARYCDALKEIAEYYSIPVLDLYHGSNLRPWDDTFRDLYYKRDDGGSVHPDEDGHALLANKFEMFIRSL